MAITFNRFSTAAIVATGYDSLACTSTTGNMLVAAIVSDPAIVIDSVTDNKGNTWVLKGPAYANAGGYAWAAYCVGATTGVTSLIVTSNGADGSSGFTVGLYDFSSATGGAFDLYAASSANFGGSPTTTISPTAAGVVVSVVTLNPPASAVSSPYTLESIDQSVIYYSAATAYYLNGAAGSTTATYTAGGYSFNWGSIAISFKESGSSTCATPTYSPVAGSYGPTQSVTISCATVGSSITYTTDGSTPVPGSHGTVYTTPVSVASSLTIKSVASAGGYLNSSEADATYTITGAAANPVYSPAAGSYGPTQSVTITCSTPSSTITYTIDGSTPIPGVHGTVYSGAITVAVTTTIKAIASASGYANSSEIDATYTITGACATPTYSPVAGSYGGTQSVTIACTTPASTITYTTDGSTPVPGSHGTVYTVPISVSVTTTIKAIGSAGGYSNSAEADALYMITGSAAAPTFSPVAGIYGTSQTVTLACSTPGNTITYTVDGTIPIPGSHGYVYTGAITVATTTSVNAIASATGYANSVVSSATYVISNNLLMNLSPNLALALLISGQNQPEITVNQDIIGLDEAMNSNSSFGVTNSGLTLTLSEFASNFLLVFTGTLTQSITITVPAISRFFAVLNLTSGAYNINVIGTQTSSPYFPAVAVAPSSTEPTLLYCTGVTGQILSFTTSGGGGGLLPTPTTISLSASVPAGGGNFQVAHTLGVTPVAAIIQMTSGGSIYFQTSRYDGTYLYLTASDGGITGDALVWA